MNTSATIAARLDRLPLTRTIWRLVTLISIGGAFEFYDIFLAAYIAPGLNAGGVFKGSTLGLFGIGGMGFFIFCSFMGMFLGCMAFGPVADRFGRRSIFVTALLWYSAATAVMAFQTTAAGVDFWRFIASIGVGLEQVTIDTYLPELVPPAHRGKAFAYYQLIAFSVVPVVALLGWLWVPQTIFGLEGWRWVTLVGSGGAVLAWWLRRGLPESPRWLAIHGRMAEADLVVSKLEAAIVKETGQPLPAPVSRPVIATSGASGLADLFRPTYRSRTLVMSIFNLVQTIGFYGFASWVPTLLIARGIRITTSLQYSFIIALAAPLGPLVGMFVADKVERKWQLVAAGVTIGTFMFLFAHQTLPAILIACGVVVTLANNWMSFAFHNYQAELFPTRIRGRAVGFVYGWSRLSAAFAGLAIGWILKQGGTPAVALFIGAAMTIMVITIGGFGPRTRGRSLEDISGQ
jgi:MFS transporter, putative metabolite:H+ symporter